MAPRSISSIFLVAVASLFASACGTHTHYIPLTSAGLTLSGDRATARNERVNVTVEHTRLESSSYSLDDRLIVFRVGMRNLSARPVTFAPEQFLLLDASGRQYSAIPTQLIAAAEGGFDCYPRYGTGIGWGWGWGGSRQWGAGMNYYGSDYRCNSQLGEEILSESLFPLAPLQPDARVTGLVFFRGNAEHTGPLRMEIHFSDAATLIFPFRPEPEDGD